MRILMVLLLLLMNSLSLVAQVKMFGKITTDDNGAVVAAPFVNVVLYDLVDTAKVVVGVITDFEGNYLFDNVQMGNYRLEVSSVGYKRLTKNIRVQMPSMGNSLQRNYQIEKDKVQLSEVVVKASNTTQYVDKSARTFTQEEIKSARYSKDLLSILPELIVDPQTERLANINGGAMQILINGVAASDNELKLIPPQKVLRVEYYDIPPARYAKSGSVVNVITKKLDDGYSGGFNVSHAFTTGFGNDDVYFRYNHGRSQFTLEYTVNYRDYKDRENTELYKYKLNDEQRESSYQKKEAFGYTTHTVGLKYTNQIADKYMFQLALKPNYRSSFNEGTKDVTNKFGLEESDLMGDFASNMRTFSPVIDIYYWKKISAMSELLFNLVGTMFNTKVDKQNSEYTLPEMDETLSDVMSLVNRKESLIGELVYVRNTTLGKLSAGYRMNMNWLDSDISNYFGKYNYGSRYDEHYLYTELAGKKDSWMYRIGLGGTVIDNQSYLNEYSRFAFTPKLILGYSINSKQSLRLVASRGMLLPSVSDLSNNAQLLTLDIANTGNPLLENATEWGSALVYSLNAKYLAVSMGTLYSYTNDAINEYFKYDEDLNYIVLTKENADCFQTYGGIVSAQVKPFGTNVFSIKSNLRFMKQTIQSKYAGKFTNTYIPLTLQAVFKQKNLTLSCMHKFVSQKLSGAYLVDDENMSSLKAVYNYKNISLSTAFLWLGEPSRYHSETYGGSVVDYISSTRIWDNRNMFIIGLSWSFSSGKAYKINRTLNNKDQDPATF